MGSEVRSYRDLLIWEKGINLVKEIYLLSNKFPQKEVYGLSNQIRRAAISIPSNIAEGQARQHTAEFRQALYIALGSLAEVDTQLVIAQELNFLNKNELNTTYNMISELRKMLNSLIRIMPNNSSLTTCHCDYQPPTGNNQLRTTN